MPVDEERQLYFTDKGAGPIPVLTQTEYDQLRHLSNPFMFMAGVRVAVCNQSIELNWCVAWRADGPLPICTECIRTVEEIA